MIGGAEGDRTPDLMTASAVKSTASGYGSYDLLTFVTGCSRQRVHLLPPITPNLRLVLSQVCHRSSRYKRGHDLLCLDAWPCWLHEK